MRNLLAAVLLSALAATGLAQTGPQPPLPTVKLTAGMHLITAELADDDRERMVGLMFRDQLAPNHGMLFDFKGRAIHCMWMRNTPIPLSVAYLEDDGTIINIEDMAPKTEDSHCAKKPVRFALEMDRGWFAQRGIKPGMKLAGLPAQ